MILEKKYLQPLPDINVNCEIYFVVHKIFYKFQPLKVVELHCYISLITSVRRAILSIPNINIIVVNNIQVDFEVS